MWYSVVCTLIDNDMRHHSGQNLMWTHSAAPHFDSCSLTRLRLILTVVKICCGLTRLRLVSPQHFDHCDDAYLCRYEYRQR